VSHRQALKRLYRAVLTALLGLAAKFEPVPS
jgi:hypothetical protein